MNADYTAYINSSKWKSLSAKIRNRDGNKCKLCDSERILEVHHLSYVRLGKERNADLVTLCQSCHAEQHKLVRLIMANRPKLSKNLALRQAWSLTVKKEDSLKTRNRKLKKAERKLKSVESKKERAEMEKAHIDSLKRLGRIDENGKRIPKKKKNKKSPIVKTIKVPRNAKVPN